MTSRLLLLSAVLLAAGCRDTADGAREDARRAAREAEQAAKDAAREAERAAKDARREVERAAADAREGVREAMDEAGGAVREARSAAREAGRDMRDAAPDLHGAKQLVDVRAALTVSKEISSASAISVSTDDAGRTIILDGTVPTAAEKAAAQRIARASADGMRVRNRLQVVPPR